MKSSYELEKKLAILKQIFTRGGRYWNTISISPTGNSEIDKEISRLVVIHCSNIRDLFITSEYISDLDVAALFRKNKRLKTIGLYSLKIPKSSSTDLGNTLETIQLEDVSSVDPQFLHNLLRNSPNLEIFRLRKFDLTHFKAAINGLLESNCSLKTLSLSNRSNYINVPTELIQLLNKLKLISLRSVQTFNEKVLDSLGSCDHLEELDIGTDKVNLSTSAFGKFVKFKNLTRVDFGAGNDQLVKAFSCHCPNLVHIGLENYDATQKGLRDLSVLPNLESLRLVGTDSLERDRPVLPSRSFMSTGGPENISSMKSRAFFKKLTKIWIERQRFMCDDFLQLVSFCSSLKSLNLSSGDFSAIGPTGGLALAELKDLEILRVSETSNMHYSMFKAFSECQKLTHINLFSCSRIDNYFCVMHFLSDLPNLKGLYLGDTFEDELTLENFEDFSGLEYLTIDGCYNIDEQDLRALPGMLNTDICVYSRFQTRN